MGKNSGQAQQRLEKCYSNCCTPSKTTICRWYVDFKCGHTDTNDADRSGRPNEAVTQENNRQVLKIIMDDQKLKVCEIAEMVNISTGSAPMILHEKLSIEGSFQMSATFVHSGTKAKMNR